MGNNTKKGGVVNQPLLFSLQDKSDTEAFRQQLLEILQEMKIETDSPLLGWWTERNATLDLVIKMVKGL